MPTTHRELPKIQGLKRRPTDPRAPARPARVVEKAPPIPIIAVCYRYLCNDFVFVSRLEKLSWQNEFELLMIRSSCRGTACTAPLQVVKTDIKYHQS